MKNITNKKQKFGHVPFLLDHNIKISISIFLQTCREWLFYQNKPLVNRPKKGTSKIPTVPKIWNCLKIKIWGINFTCAHCTYFEATPPEKARVYIFFLNIFMCSETSKKFIYIILDYFYKSLSGLRDWIYDMRDFTLENRKHPLNPGRYFTIPGSIL